MVSVNFKSNANYNQILPDLKGKKKVSKKEKEREQAEEKRIELEKLKQKQIEDELEQRKRDIEMAEERQKQEIVENNLRKQQLQESLSYFQGEGEHFGIHLMYQNYFQILGTIFTRFSSSLRNNKIGCGICDAMDCLMLIKPVIYGIVSVLSLCSELQSLYLRKKTVISES